MSRLFRADSYPAHAAAEGDLDPERCVPVFHMDGAVSLSVSIEYFSKIISNWEPLLWRGEWVVHPQRVSSAFFSMLCPPFSRRAGALSLGGHAAHGQAPGFPGISVQAASCVASWRQFTSACLFSHSHRMGRMVLALLLSDWIHELFKQFLKRQRKKKIFIFRRGTEIKRRLQHCQNLKWRKRTFGISS